MMSLQNDQQECTFFLFDLTCQKVLIETHRIESRFVVRPPEKRTFCRLFSARKFYKLSVQRRVKGFIEGG